MQGQPRKPGASRRETTDRPMVVANHRGRIPRGARGLVLAAWAAVALAPVAWSQEAPALERVPHPDLSTLPGEKAEALRPAVEFFENQRGSLEGRQLGLAFGRLGLNYLAQEQGAAAAAALRNAMALDPTNARWPYFLALYYDESGQAEEAVEAYRKSLRNQTGYLPGYLRLGDALLSLDRLKEAEAAFQVVLGVDRDNPPALAGMGRVALAQGDARRAVGLFTRALRIQPQATVLHGDLAAAYRALGETAEAEQAEAEAGDVEPVTEDPLYAFLYAHEQGADHYLTAAAVAEKLGEAAAAIRMYEVAAALRPGDTRTLVRLGELQAGAGQADEALFSFARVLALEPGNVKANYYTGMLMEQRGDEAAAEQHYRAALAREEQLVEPRMLLANILMRRGEYDQAGEEYARIAHQLPGSVEVMHLLGLAWLAAGQCQWAHPVLLRALNMAPGDPAVTTALSRAYATCPGVTEEQQARALEAARVMYETRPGMETAATLAMTSAAAGNFSDAVDFQTQAIFEALKAEDQQRLSWLKENLDHYEAGQPAASPWPAGAEVYRPRRLAPVVPVPAEAAATPAAEAPPAGGS